MNNGVQANGEPKPDTIIESIQEVDSRRGSVKVIWPLLSVWSNAKGFGISMKAKADPAAKHVYAFAFDVEAKKTDDTPSPRTTKQRRPMSQRCVYD
jgi:hypothetical protein